jgi:hypothetical protein
VSSGERGFSRKDGAGDVAVSCPVCGTNGGAVHVSPVPAVAGRTSLPSGEYAQCCVRAQCATLVVVAGPQCKAASAGDDVATMSHCKGLFGTEGDEVLSEEGLDLISRTHVRWPSVRI